MVTDIALRRAAIAGQHAAMAVEDAVYGVGGDPADGLAAFGDAARLWDEWVGNALSLGEDEPVSGHLALSMARSAATCAHAGLHRAFDAGSGAAGDQDIGALLRGAEQEYIGALAVSRAAALTGEHTPELRDLWSRLAAPGGLAVHEACAVIGGLPAAARAVDGRGLRVSLLARRTALLAAGVVNLHRRLLTPSLRRGAMGIAGRRERLWRARPEVRVARDSLQGVAPFARVEVVGRVRSTAWVDRPDIPYSVADCGDFEVRVHRRNLAAVGVGAGRWLWARGKAEADGDRAVLVAEMEGPGAHAGSVWEDWMATELREVYDLWPRVMDITFEFPVIGRRGGVIDLAERTGGELPDV